MRAAPTVGMLVTIGLTCLTGVTAAAAGGTGRDPAVEAVPLRATLSPPPHGTGYTAGTIVDVSVAANSVFTPDAGVVMLECSDPGGLAANLPRSRSACDPLTVQPQTVFVARDGSVAYGPQAGGGAGFTIYGLPAPSLAEPAGQAVRCDVRHWCVVFVGEDPGNFSRPHVFSAPFLVITPQSGVPETPVSIALAVVGVGALGWAYLYFRRRRRSLPAAGTPES